MRHSARHLAASALALLALGAGLQLSDSMLPSGTVLAMGGKPDVQTQQTAQTGRLGSVAPQPALGGVGMADGQFGGAGEAGKEPARSGVFGSAFTGAVRGLLSGMPAWMQALGEASAPGAGLRGMGTMGSMSGMGDMTSAAGAIADPMAGASQNAKLLGTWAAPNGMSPLTIQLRKGGACTLFDKGQQVAGSWETAGDIIRLRFANGRTFHRSAGPAGFLARLERQLRRGPDLGPEDLCPQRQRKGVQGTLEGPQGLAARGLRERTAPGCGLHRGGQRPAPWRRHSAAAPVGRPAACRLPPSYTARRLRAGCRWRPQTPPRQPCRVRQARFARPGCLVEKPEACQQDVRIARDKAPC